MTALSPSVPRFVLPKSQQVEADRSQSLQQEAMSVWLQTSISNPLSLRKTKSKLKDEFDRHSIQNLCSMLQFVPGRAMASNRKIVCRSRARQIQWQGEEIRSEGTATYKYVQRIPLLLRSQGLSSRFGQTHGLVVVPDRPQEFRHCRSSWESIAREAPVRRARTKIPRGARSVSGPAM